MRDIRQSTKTPICCGENLFLRHGFRELLEKRAADIIMPDIQKCGGLLEARKIADMAYVYNVPFRRIASSPPSGTWLLVTCRGRAELPCPRVALDLPAAGVEGLRARRRNYPEGLRDGYGQTGHRRGDERRCGSKMLMPGSKWFES